MKKIIGILLLLSIFPLRCMAYEFSNIVLQDQVYRVVCSQELLGKIAKTTGIRYIPAPYVGTYNHPYESVPSNKINPSAFLFIKAEENILKIANIQTVVSPEIDNSSLNYNMHRFLYPDYELSADSSNNLQATFSLRDININGVLHPDQVDLLTIVNGGTFSPQLPAVMKNTNESFFIKSRIQLPLFNTKYLHPYTGFAEVYALNIVLTNRTTLDNIANADSVEGALKLVPDQFRSELIAFMFNDASSKTILNGEQKSTIDKIAQKQKGSFLGLKRDILRELADFSPEETINIGQKSKNKRCHAAYCDAIARTDVINKIDDHSEKSALRHNIIHGAHQKEFESLENEIAFLRKSYRNEPTLKLVSALHENVKNIRILKRVEQKKYFEQYVSAVNRLITGPLNLHPKVLDGVINELCSLSYCLEYKDSYTIKNKLREVLELAKKTTGTSMKENIGLLEENAEVLTLQSNLNNNDFALFKNELQNALGK